MWYTDVGRSMGHAAAIPSDFCSDSVIAALSVLPENASRGGNQQRRTLRLVELGEYSRLRGALRIPSVVSKCEKATAGFTCCP